MAKKFKEEWMFKMVELIHNNEYVDSKVFKTIKHSGIDPKHINVKYLQPIGIKMSRDEVFDLLNAEKLKHDQFISVETFLIWLIKVHKHQPQYLLSKTENRTRKGQEEDELKKRMRSQSVKMVGYKKLKW